MDYFWRVYGGIRFNQKAWLKLCNNKDTELRKIAKYDFGK